MRWVAHTLVIVNQVYAVGVQWTRGRRAVIHVFLTDLSGESNVACAVELGGVNRFAGAAI